MGARTDWLRNVIVKHSAIAGKARMARDLIDSFISRELVEQKMSGISETWSKSVASFIPLGQEE